MVAPRWYPDEQPSAPAGGGPSLAELLAQGDQPDPEQSWGGGGIGQTWVPPDAGPSSQDDPRGYGTAYDAPAFSSSEQAPPDWGAPSPTWGMPDEPQAIWPNPWASTNAPDAPTSPSGWDVPASLTDPYASAPPWEAPPPDTGPTFWDAAGRVVGAGITAMGIPGMIGRLGFPEPGHDSGESPGERWARLANEKGGLLAGLEAGQQPFERTLELGTQYDPTGYLAGTANTVARLGTDPGMTVGGAIPRAMQIGAAGGGVAGGLYGAATMPDRLAWADPEQTFGGGGIAFDPRETDAALAARRSAHVSGAIEGWANAGMLLGGGVDALSHLRPRGATFGDALAGEHALPPFEHAGLPGEPGVLPTFADVLAPPEAPRAAAPLGAPSIPTERGLAAIVPAEDIAHAQQAIERVAGPEAAAQFAASLPEAATPAELHAALAEVLGAAHPGEDPARLADAATTAMGYGGVTEAVDAAVVPAADLAHATAALERVAGPDAAARFAAALPEAATPEQLHAALADALGSAHPGEDPVALADAATTAMGYRGLGGGVLGGAAGYVGQEPQRPDESTPDYWLRVGLATVGGAAAGAGTAMLATAEGRAALVAMGRRATEAGVVPGMSIKPTAGELAAANAPEMGALNRQRHGFDPIAQHEYQPGSVEHGVEAGLRAGAAASPDGLAHLSPDELAALPGAPRAAVPGETLPKQYQRQGTPRSLDDIRAAIEAGAPYKDWYTHVARYLEGVVGDANMPEAQTIFGITSGQTQVADNVAQTFWVMTKARELLPLNLTQEQFATALLDDLLDRRGTKTAYYAMKDAVAALGKGSTKEERAAAVQAAVEALPEGTTNRISVPWARTFTDAKADAIADAYYNGRRFSGAGKTPSYAGNIETALAGVYDPNSTNDAYMLRDLFGYAEKDAAGGGDDTYRFVNATQNYLARELGIIPNQAQAAAWIAVRQLKVDPLGQPLLAAVNKGTMSLGDAVRRATELGVYDRFPGNLDEIVTNPHINEWRATLEAGLDTTTPLRPDMRLEYAGQGRKGGQIERPVNADMRARYAAAAGAQAPGFEVSGADLARAAGHDPATNTLDWIAQPHTATDTGQGLHVSFPGGNVDTVRYYASVLGDATGAEAVTTRFHDPAADTLTGLLLYHPSGAAHDVQAVRAALAGTGATVVDNAGAGGLEILFPRGAPESVTEQVVARLGASGYSADSYGALRGVTHDVRQADYAGHIAALGRRFGAPGSSDLQAGAVARARAASQEGAATRDAAGGAARGLAAEAGGVDLGYATHLGGAVGGAAIGQTGTDETTPWQERLTRGVLGATAGLGLARAATGAGGVSRALGAADGGLTPEQVARWRAAAEAAGPRVPEAGAAGAALTPEQIARWRAAGEAAGPRIPQPGELPPTGGDWASLGQAPTPEELALARARGRIPQTPPEPAPSAPPLPGTASAPATLAPRDTARFVLGTRTWLETRAGEAGTDLGWRLSNWRDTAEPMAGTWLDAMPTVKSLTNRERLELRARLITPGGPEASARVEQAASEWNAVAAGVDASAQHLGVTGIEMPGIDLKQEVEKAANTLAKAQLFGPGGEIATTLINKIAADGHDARTARQLYDIAVGATTGGDTALAWSRAARNVNAFLSLDLGFIGNLTQSVNTASVVGIMRTAKYFGKAMTAAGKAEATRMGVILDGAIASVREGQGIGAAEGMAGRGARVLNAATAPLFGRVERFNRTLPVLAGIDYVEEMARHAASGTDPAAVATLNRLGLSGETIAARGGVLTAEERLLGARKVVEVTQYKVDAMDLPGWASSPGGKVVAQFRSFGFRQGSFILDQILAPALRSEHRDVRPLARWVALGLPVGAAANAVREWITGDDSHADESWAQTGLRAMQRVGGIGLAGDVLESASRLPDQRLGAQARTVASTVLGPTAGRLVQGVNLVDEAVHGHPGQLERTLLRDVPPVIGPRLQEALLPYARIAVSDQTKRVLAEHAVPLTSGKPPPSDSTWTDGQQALRSTMLGPVIDRQVGALVGSPQWNGWDHGQRARALAAAVARARYDKENDKDVWHEIVQEPGRAGVSVATYMEKPPTEARLVALVTGRSKPSGMGEPTMLKEYRSGWVPRNGGGSPTDPATIKRFIASWP